MYGAVNVQGESEDPLQTVARLVHKGVMLWVNNGVLRYRAPRGLITSAELESLHRASAVIVPLLERNSHYTGKAGNTGELSLCPAPLSFTQLAHWHFRMQSGARPLREVTSATRLQGKLLVEPLQEAINHIVCRHDALRTHIRLRGGVPLQEVDTTDEGIFERVNLETVRRDQWSAVIQNHIECALLDAKDYAVDPLFRAILLKFTESDHVLILALDHIISDGYSLALLSGELWTAYTRLVNRKPIDLPKVGMQFAEFALLQRVRRQALTNSLDPKRCDFGRTRFPDDPLGAVEEHRNGWGTSRFWIGADLLPALREWVRVQRTTLVMAVFTAYAAAVLRWCNVRETVIQFMIDGRMSDEIRYTVGYFAFPLFIKIALSDRDTFVDLLKTVTVDYCRASDEADLGYTQAQSPRPAFTRNSCFNWLPNSFTDDEIRWERAEYAIRHSGIEFAFPTLEAGGCDLDNEPSIVVSQRVEGILCELQFPRRRFSVRSIERFERQVTGSVVAMLDSPASCVTDLVIR